jgi:hypothetical protein
LHRTWFTLYTLLLLQRPTPTMVPLY